jgi:ABC-type uncharacterized transport system permease subunit
MHSATLLAGSAVPLIALLLFPALGELIAERAGTLNISVEAMLRCSGPWKERLLRCRRLG